LRQNGGGGDSGVAAVLLSHLLPGAATRLSELHWKPDGSVRSFWTLPSVPGGKYLAPVYVLMSGRLFRQPRASPIRCKRGNVRFLWARRRPAEFTRSSTDRSVPTWACSFLPAAMWTP
jgi:hypothetical protein